MSAAGDGQWVINYRGESRWCRPSVVQLSSDLERAYREGRKPRVREGQYGGLTIEEVLAGARASHAFLKRNGLVGIDADQTTAASNRNRATRA